MEDRVPSSPISGLSVKAPYLAPGVSTNIRKQEERE
jgi:hypothetical protein